jgi:hypothetical protein
MDLGDGGVTCDDDDPCTKKDICVQGECRGSEIGSCENDDGCCPCDCTKINDNDCSKDFNFVPSNVADVSDYSDAAVRVVLSCGPSIFDSKTHTFDNWCGEKKPRVFNIAHDTLLIPLDYLQIKEGSELRITGDFPVVLLVYTNAVIHGNLDVGARGSMAGSGADPEQCGKGGNGTVMPPFFGGGGGGGFGEVGGSGCTSSPTASGGSGGNVNGESFLVPLRGGCSGGSGGGGVPSGGGGGAVQVSASGLLRVGRLAVISSRGGGEQGAKLKAGSGGGSGGAILLEANEIQIERGAWITANGGGGGAGNEEEAGENGYIHSATKANGAGEGGKGSEGGKGGTELGRATAGRGYSWNYYGAGGGGGVGRIVINGGTCELNGSFSPEPLKNCN